jgi:plasmid maintenance system killer protein
MGQNNVVFFLGAGFSCEADMPAMSEFAKISEHEFNYTSKYAFAHINEKKELDYRYAAPLIYEAGIIYRAFRRYCKVNKLPKEITKLDDLEWLFQQAEELDSEEIDMEFEVIKTTGYCNFSVSKREITIALQFWAWKIFNRLPILSKGKVIHFLREPNWKLYEKFSMILTKQYSINNISVITTNYDLILEYSLWKLPQAPKAYYPLKYRPIPIDNNSEEFIGSSRYGIPFYKIHGSVNYYTKKSDNNSLSVSCDLANKTIGMSKIINEPVTIHYDGLLGIRYKYGSDLVPEIVPPSKKAYESNDKTKKLPKWQEQVICGAKKKLENADKIIFIGYSLPKTDEYLKNMLKINTNPNASIFVINPDSIGEVNANYRQVYKNYQFVRKLFSNSLDDIEAFLSK